jgi:signal transduction histidine kinase
LEDVLKSVLRHAIEISNTDRGFIVLKDRSEDLVYKMGLDLEGNFLPESEFQVSTTVVKDVFQTGESRFMEDAQSDRDNKKSKSIYNLELRTILCSPLIIDKKKIGVIYVDSKSLHKINVSEITYTFEILAGQAASAIRNAQLYNEQIKYNNKLEKLNNELKLAKDKAEKSDRLKTHFLAQMSHEIRTPINTIFSFNSLLRDEMQEKLNVDYPEIFEIIERAGKRIMRTIDSILQMSMLQTGNIEINYEKVNLSEDILNNVIKEFTTFADEKNLELNFTNETRKNIVEADSYMLTQLFGNLLDNAIKYTEQGKVEIRQFEDKDGKVCVEVSDTGIGISKDYIRNLFSPFSQEETGYTRKFDGNGLGLALVKRYCDLNNAGIQVDSKKGKGSKFTVTFNPID